MVECEREAREEDREREGRDQRPAGKAPRDLWSDLSAERAADGERYGDLPIDVALEGMCRDTGG